MRKTRISGGKVHGLSNGSAGITFLKKHAFFLACVLLVMTVWSFRLAALQLAGSNDIMTYNSDEVAQQNILWDWQHGLHQGATVGDDTWFLKFPLYIIINNLPIGPLAKLMLTRWLLLLATCLLILWVLNEFIKRFNAKHSTQQYSLALTSLLLASVPAGIFFIFKMPNSRNIEVGIILFLLLQLYRYIYEEGWLVKHRSWKLAGLLLLSASLFVNDPLFLYFGLAPLLVAIAWQYVFGSLPLEKAKSIGLFSLTSLVLYKLIKHVLVAYLPLGLLAHSSHIVTYDGFLKNIRTFFTYGLQTVGIDFRGTHYASLATIESLLFLAIFGALIYTVYKHGLLGKKIFFRNLLLIIAVINLAVMLTSSLMAADTVGRYLIMLVAIGFLVFSVSLTSIRVKRQQVALALVLILLCTLTVFSSFRKIMPGTDRQPHHVQQLIQVLEQNHLSKGYANYWNAGITTYLSGHAIHVLPVTCSPEHPQLVFYNVLTERAAIKELQPKKSFYVYSSQYEPMCTPAQLEPLLGKTSKLIPLNDEGHTTVAVYDYDISPRLSY